MYALRSNLILGFHGCEKEDQEKLLSLKTIITSTQLIQSVLLLLKEKRSIPELDLMKKLIFKFV